MQPHRRAAGYDRSAKGAHVSRHAIGRGDKSPTRPARAGRRTAPLPTASPARPAAPADWLTRLRQPHIRLYTRHWLIVSGGSLVLFFARFLLPAPVAMADNGDGSRLMCGLGVAPVTGGLPRYDAFAYFTFTPSPGCANAPIYPSSEHLLLAAARDLTPLLRLPGTISLIALGLITCVLQSAGIASLACGLRLRLRYTILLAAALWLFMADASFFDTYAGPYSEGAALTGLLLVAAGVVYLGRGPLGFAFGLLMAAVGGYLAVLSKEQYVLLAVPVCAVILAATASRSNRGLARLLTARMAAAALVAGLLGAGAVAYAQHEAASPYAATMHQEQAVNVIFQDIVNGHDNAAADLQALGLPASWARYAGTSFWAPRSVYHDPLYPRYASRLTDGTVIRFLLAHPADLFSIGQRAANSALQLRVNYLGSYQPDAGHPAGTLENRVTVLTSLVQAIPAGLGLLWLLQLWAVMAAIAGWALRTARPAPGWHRDAAFAIVLLTGCAVTAFIPAAYLDGLGITRHMLGSNLATALAFGLSAVLLASMVRHGIAAAGAGDHASGVAAVPAPRPPEQARPAVTTGRPDAGRCCQPRKPRSSAAVPSRCSATAALARPASPSRIACTIAACWPAVWSMLRCSTGIAFSRSLSRQRASAQAAVSRLEPASSAMLRWNRVSSRR
jgi:hypothetical protein